MVGRRPLSATEMYFRWLEITLLLVHLASHATVATGVKATAAHSSSLSQYMYGQQQQQTQQQTQQQQTHRLRSRQVRWMVDAGRAKQGVQPWATFVASKHAITGLVGCCGRFHIGSNGTWFDEWSESKFPLTNWNFTKDLDLTMHFVITVDQLALINQTALLAIPEAIATAVSTDFTGYALDYETPPAGGWGSVAFQAETDGLLIFVTRFAAALKEVGKELLVDMGGTTAASLSTQGCAMNQTEICSFQRSLLHRWANSGVSSLVEMGTYYGTDLRFNEIVLQEPLYGGIPARMLSSGIGSSTTAGCGCGIGSSRSDNRSCCAPHACCGPAQAAWAHEPPFEPVPACVGAPCGGCKTLGTRLPCYNWTAGTCRCPTWICISACTLASDNTLECFSIHIAKLRTARTTLVHCW